jgi:hypothetical protein
MGSGSASNDPYQVKRRTRIRINVMRIRNTGRNKIGNYISSGPSNQGNKIFDKFFLQCRYTEYGLHDTKTPKRTYVFATAKSRIVTEKET